MTHSTTRNLIAILVGVLCLATRALAGTDDALQSKIEAMAREHHGRLALYAVNLTTGVTVALDPERPVATASVIKLGILIQVMEEVKAGKRKLSDRVTLRPDDPVKGSGVLQLLDTPLTLTWKDLLTLMLIESDNTATNVILDRVGVKPVNERMAALGLKSTYLYKKVSKPATEPMPPDQKQFGLGKTTAREMARVMESIVRCESGAPKLCEAMLFMLRNQRSRNGIPRYIDTTPASEDASFIANKTGALEAARNDVGVIFSKAGPIIISAFTYDNEDKSWNPENAGELLIARTAKVIMEAWSPDGLARELPKPSGRPSPSDR